MLQICFECIFRHLRIPTKSSNLHIADHWCHIVACIPVHKDTWGNSTTKFMLLDYTTLENSIHRIQKKTPGRSRSKFITSTRYQFPLLSQLRASISMNFFLSDDHYSRVQMSLYSSTRQYRSSFKALCKGILPCYNYR